MSRSRIRNGVAGEMVAFPDFPAFLMRSYGSPKTQNLKDAAAHAQGIASLARAAA